MAKRKPPPTRSGRGKNRPVRPPGVRSMSAPTRTFLEKAGIDVSLPQLLDTPQRVAQSWSEEFLDGYHADPLLILQDSFETDGRPAEGSSDLVLVKDIPFHALCPHHLLPPQGRARTACVPDGQ